MNIKNSLLFLLALGACFVAADAQVQAPLEKGVAIKQVALQKDAGQSYALYLPANYTADKKWPILYCFDPIARGSVPVERFQKAAEKFGYIVAGSNNSRNSMPPKDLVTTLQDLWGDTHQRFSIDEKRVYTCGLSGGARVASFFAFSCKGCIRGVIGNGAGFMADMKPTAQMPFIFFGTAGVEDFNYPELKKLTNNLSELGIANYFEPFDGKHEWLTEAVAERALLWMEIRAMNDGMRAKDDALVDATYQSRMAEAKKYADENKILDSYRVYVGITADLAALRDTKEASEIVAKLKDSPALRSAVREEDAQFARQVKSVSALFALSRKMRAKHSAASPANAEENGPDTQTEFRDMIERLRKEAAQKNDGSERLAARRAIAELIIGFYQTAGTAERAGDLDGAAAEVELITRIAPDNAWAWYDLARLSALQRKTKPALSALEKAVAAGFSERAVLDKEKAFDAMRETERFQKIVTGIKNK